MKIAYCSDIHWEFSDCFLNNDEKADVLVLAGDILISKSMTYYKFMLDHLVEEFCNIVIVAGNHEFYHNRIDKGLDALLTTYSKYPQIRFLENDCVEIDDVMFVGGTLWTNFNNYHPLTMYHVKTGMSDFSIISIKDGNVYRKFSPEDAVRKFERTKQYIETVTSINSDRKVVVVTHHAPSFQSVHEKYSSDYLMNGGYCSDLEQLMHDRENIKVWIHGHTHTPFDYTINKTRVLCNPRGYKGYEKIAETFKLKYIEV